MRIALIVPAAGASGRFLAAGGVRSKLDEDLGGKPLLQRTIETFAKFDDDDATIASMIVAGPHEDAAFEDFRERHADRLGLLGARVVRGGKTHRWETVRAALAHVPEDATHVAVHDAARPCVSFELLRRVFGAARTHAAVVPALRVHDTVKRVRDEGGATSAGNPQDELAARILGGASARGNVRRVVETLDRDGLVLVQTPQVFSRELLTRAYAQANLEGVTDDASVVERLGEAVFVVEGEARNIKVTLPEDVTLARALMGFAEPAGKAAHKRF